MPAVPDCAKVIVTNGLTCDSCGRTVAQYRNHRKADKPVEWGHRRGAAQGAAATSRRMVAEAAARALAAERRADIAEARTADLEAILRDIPARLDRIEAAVLWKPNHRRLADGGESVRDQRRRFGA